ncbi:MAG: AraC family transcriptional regulator, partial [Lachnospiraceae bacterium]|nr:AraC family transcriptional regulator [Lachnospiraceae bacterium]
CYSKVNHLFSYRFLMPQEHVFTKELTGRGASQETGGGIDGIEADRTDPELIRDFLLRGAKDEIADFVENYLSEMKEAMQSVMFQNYLTLHIYFVILSYVELLGCGREEFLRLLGEMTPDSVSGAEKLSAYFCSLLEKAMMLRDRESDDQSKRVLKKALSYIEENYSQESLSLNSVAGEVNVSASYFSAIFSRAMQVTFVEYVTGKRMDKAKKLLRQTQMHTGEIAQEVGYKDPHYFSFVFKKTQGCTPREYRAGAKA